jgi:hypothetical protein
MSNIRPGLNPHRLVNLIGQAIQRCDLQLSGLRVLTEAATGAYVVTPIIAAMAGATKVYALVQGSRYGSIEEVQTLTQTLAELAGVSDRIEFVPEKSRAILEQVDIVTNSGHVRPLDAEAISWMQASSVIGLMYEAWEFRADDLDLLACHQRGIQVAGVNECHPNVDVFSFLGAMAVKLLLDAGISVYTSRILLLCDNPFLKFIEHGLVSTGATVDLVDNLAVAAIDNTYDAVLVALHPQAEPVLGEAEAVLIAKHFPGTVVAQYWGDIDRSAFSIQQIPLWPETAPKAGHMGILPSGVGPEPIIRLQTGGLKAAEVAWRQQQSQQPPEALEYVQLL